ncbi:non-ribosomal peptide synthetase [Streptomyces iranensis]|uniref:Acyl-CoA synthetase (AMP-forming)/AMP-acid ligase II/acyl carrier protein n=1 Tax=Streptomyces iranensis TaxID=576784 RepID=A0A060ZDK6_9ACTN|nr:non-ribosomal peptide synthetase [Streptomyces iranensis]MBP2067103.1 acyl-CoA synthetase (AMP-forming)/AMP-acid ligase II/acyl carrier protein [Streptomyces iranensis]CDR02699.1 acyl-CoA synthetase, long chain-fatty acid:CoAligase [Streptomyces iranensis]
MSNPDAGSPVLAVIERHARIRGDAPAILAPGDPAGLSYRRLSGRMHAVRAALTGLGVRPGHRVAVVPGEDADSAALLLGVLAAAACCPVNPLWSATETQDYLDTLDVALIVLADGAGTAAAQQVAAAKAPAVTLRFTGEDLVVEPQDGGRPAETAATGPYPDEALLLRTSGTTSIGKVVSLSAAGVVAAAQATVDAYHLTDSDRRFNIMPFFHVQGLVGSLIASLLPGGSIVCAPAPDPATALRHALDSEATWLSATPTMHRLMVRHVPRDRDWPGPLRFVRCGSGALTAGLRAELETGYGLPVVESYGMSEAHQIASTPLPGDPGAAGLVPTGSEVAVLDQHGQVSTAPDASGEIVIRGANVMHGYVWPPGLKSPFVRGGSAGDTEGAGWLRTGDLGRLLPDGSFLITGRVKEMINVGGEKVSPFEVEAAMLSHPAVAEAVAFGIPDPVRDEHLGAVLVLGPGATLGDEEFRTYLGQRLAPVKVPRVFLRRADIPVAESGKIQRGSLARVLAEELTAAGPTAESDGRTAPRTPVEAMLKGLWSLVLKREDIGVDNDFMALGGDSMAGMALLSLVEDSLGVAITPAELFTDITTIEAMAAAIGERTSGTTEGAGR